MVRAITGAATEAHVEAVQQLDVAGYLGHVSSDMETHGSTGLRFSVDLAVLPLLEQDERFGQGFLHGLHKDIGKDLTDFRSFNGKLGRGSLQIVVDRKTGNAYMDIDHHNPYNDLVRFVGHSGEVAGHFLGRARATSRCRRATTCRTCRTWSSPTWRRGRRSGSRATAPSSSRTTGGTSCSMPIRKRWTLRSTCAGASTNATGSETSGELC
jgi:hypothetical protein